MPKQDYPFAGPVRIRFEGVPARRSSPRNARSQRCPVVGRPGAHSPRAVATVPGAGNPRRPRASGRLWPRSPCLPTWRLRRIGRPLRCLQPRIERLHQEAISYVSVLQGVTYARPTFRARVPGGNAQRTCRSARNRLSAPPLGNIMPPPCVHGRHSRVSRPGRLTLYLLRGAYQQVSQCVTAPEGRSGPSPRDDAIGLDHWSRRSTGPRPGSDKPATTGSRHASKHGANMGTKRTHKNGPGAMKPQVSTGAPPGNSNPQPAD